LYRYTNIQSLVLLNIPEEHKFKYFRALQKLLEIRDSILNEANVSEAILEEYKACFKYISEINAIIKNI
jgi:hypothetical protein